MQRGLALALAAMSGTAVLTACDNTRTAEGETAISEAEVSTEAPESVVSDEQLNAAAQAGAELASPPDVVAVPVPVPDQGGTAMQNGTAGANTQAPQQNMAQ